MIQREKQVCVCGLVIDKQHLLKIQQSAGNEPSRFLSYISRICGIDLDLHHHNTKYVRQGDMV